MLLIFAGNAQICRSYVNEQKLKAGEWKYLYSSYHLRGFKDCDLVMLDLWYENKAIDLYKIKRYCEDHNIKIVDMAPRMIKT